MSQLIEFVKTPKGLIITGAVLLVIVILISYNWSTIKAWFSSSETSNSNLRQIFRCPPGTSPYRDGNGRLHCE